MATNLSTLVGGRVPDYLEFGWVCPANGAAQNIPVNTITVLSCTNVVANTGNLTNVSVTNNIFTIPSGTYYYNILVKSAFYVSNGINIPSLIVLLSSNIFSDYITRGSGPDGVGVNSSNAQAQSTTYVDLEGQFVINSTGNFCLAGITGGVASARIASSADYLPTVSAPNTDQRTTIKLWKLK